MLIKVKWISDEEAEKRAGYKRQYEKSWVKGICNKSSKIIFLNIQISKMKYPVLNEVDCLLHEISHIIAPHSKIDEMIDKIGIIVDRYLFNHNRKQYRRKKICK
jgi:hypothetical protein